MARPQEIQFVIHRDVEIEAGGKVAISLKLCGSAFPPPLTSGLFLLNGEDPVFKREFTVCGELPEELLVPDVQL